MSSNKHRKQHDEASFDIFDNDPDESSPTDYPPSSRPISGPRPPGSRKANRKQEHGEGKKE